VTFHAVGTIDASPEALAPLIAAENAALTRLKTQGVIASAFLSVDRMRVLLVVEGDSEQAARAHLDRLPLVGAGQLCFALERVTAI
jgi:hypothetical protein